MAARGNNQAKKKSKLAYAPKPKIPLHPRRKILLRTQSIITAGLRGSRKLKPGALSMYMGNGQRAAVEAIGSYDLCFPSGLVIVLHNCHYASSITRGVISVSCFVVPRDGIYEIDLSNSNTNDHSTYVVSNKRAKLNLDSSLLWHYRIGHISKKRIEKLQQDGLLNLIDTKSFEKYVSWLSGKMARKPYSHQVKRVKDLLGLIYIDEYALESAARILNMVPTKKVENTPYKVRYRQAPKMSYLKVWGCKALVKRDTLAKPDKLKRRSIKCIFVVFPKETMGYSFYYSPENKVFVARNAEFFENSLITQKLSGSLEDLRIIQEEDTHPSENTSSYHDEGDQEIDEPQTALLDPESDKWLNAINVEMQSMKDNEVWDLIDLPPNGKTVDIRAIRILIAITTFYDFEIWQIDVKTAFLNGYLSKEVYRSNLKDVKSYLGRCFAMKDLGEATYILGIKIYIDRSKRLIGLCQSAYIEKILKRYFIENSKRRSIPMKEKLKLRKSQGASTLAEVKRMQNVPYALAVGSIMYANTLKYLRNTKDMFLVYGGDIKRELRVSCYTDAEYLTDANDLKYQTGYVFVLNGGAVDWMSTKQSIFATSSAEAKYIATLNAFKDRKFIFGLGVVPIIEEPIKMYCDNTRAITIANESGITKGARHYRAKVHYLRKVIEFGDVKIENVHTDDNLADPFTKALAFPKHSEHRNAFS
ncbi:retrotransposon protein, putative, ty1-copia subclass [Tanacetum coccineum]